MKELKIIEVFAVSPEVAIGVSSTPYVSCTMGKCEDGSYALLCGNYTSEDEKKSVSYFKEKFGIK